MSTRGDLYRQALGLGAAPDDPQAALAERIKNWRAHPNYGKHCVCGHASILHKAGEGSCSWVGSPAPCECQAFSAADTPETEETLP